jgi:hypothetical protein
MDSLGSRVDRAWSIWPRLGGSCGARSRLRPCTMCSSREAAVDVRAPFEPQAIDIPWAPVPTVVPVGPADADLAMALWDVTWAASATDSEYVGLLDALPLG